MTQQPYLTLVKKKAPLKNISKISFDNKTIERIIFLLFFMTHWLKQLFLTPSAHSVTLTLVFTLLNLLEYKVFNFNKVVNKLYVKAFLDHESTLFCDCADPLFVDNSHNHIITSN